MVVSGLWDVNQALVWHKHPKSEFCGPENILDRDTVICRQGLNFLIQAVYGYSGSRILIFDKISGCHVIRILWRSVSCCGLDPADIPEFFRNYPQKTSTLSMNRFVSYLVSCFSKNSTETISLWNFNPSVRVWCQNHTKWQKITQYCQKRSEVTQIGPNIGLCGENKTSTNLEFFLENLRSTIGPPGLNIGRSESNEGSIFVSVTFRAQRECF